MDPQAAFLAEVEAFLERTGMPATTFGMETVGDPMFVADLRGPRRGRTTPREPRFRTIQRAREFMAKHKVAA